MNNAPDRALTELLAELLRPAVVEAVAAEVRAALEQQAVSLTTPAPLLSIAEAAERAGVCAETVRRRVRSGDLPAVTSLGRRPRIRPEDLDHFLKAERQTDEH